jgi:hypothetical protein
MKSHTAGRLGFDEGPSAAGFTAAVTLFVHRFATEPEFKV